MSLESTFVDITRQQAVVLADDRVYTFLDNGVDEKKHLTYRQLDQSALQIAANLQQHYQVQKGDRVVLLFCPGLDFIEAFLGCLYLGAIAVPVNPPGAGQTWGNFLAILESADASALLADKVKAGFLERQYQISGDAPLTCPVIDVAELDSTVVGSLEMPEIALDDIAMLQYTSGTTSIPKGVVITHGNIMHNQQMIQEQITGDYKIGVSWLPVYHDMGLFGSILQSIFVGGHCIVMPPSSFLAKPVRWLEAITKYRANVSGYPNFALDLCVDTISDKQIAALDLSSWKVAASGGEPVLASSQQRFADRFKACGFDAAAYVPCYGLAESTLLACARKPDPHAPPSQIDVSRSALAESRIDLDPAADDIKQFVSCGVPFAGDIIIVDPMDNKQLQEDEVGEIWIRGESTAVGYWHEPEKTSEVFHARIAGEGGYYRTGDLGFLHKGEIYISGRIKDLVIIHGKNHFPGDIERTVQASNESLMLDCGAVFSIEIDELEKIIILQEVKFTDRNTIDTDAAMGAIKQAVTKNHEVEAHAIAILKPGAIPKTSSGKVKRSLCKSLWLNDEFEVIDEWRSSEMQAYISGKPQQRVTNTFDESAEITVDTIAERLQVWVANKKNVGKDQIACDVSYAALGIDSVDIMALFGEMETWLGLRIDPEQLELWDAETLQDISVILYEVWKDPDKFKSQDDRDETEGFI